MCPRVSQCTLHDGQSVLWGQPLDELRAQRSPGERACPRVSQSTLHDGQSGLWGLPLDER